ncbi:4-demethylwyosine synthase TYW1 [Candidatus Micrarchaeota archaeon]|nr:MAG: 4-demethylwyosine synthase TYW1 [Candidatus Micrarchaeota archaeon]
MSSAYVQILRKQHYNVFGKREHSAAKLCTWTKKSIKNQGVCYKQKFYGIQSHRCLQMTPCIYCQQRCVFCWRTYGPSPDVLPKEWDEPEHIYEESIKAQRKLLSGLGGIPEQIDIQKYEEAMNPNQVAISLTGEPTLYPYLPELIGVYKRHGFSTFVVSNGLAPEMIDKIEPTNLYISLDAPNRELHKKIDRPLVDKAWDSIMQSLSMLKEKKNNTVVRITMVKGLNDVNPEQYAKILDETASTYVEVKAYMFIGGSRQRLSISNMPRHHEVKAFAQQILKHSSLYEYKDEQEASRVVLLEKRDK